MSEVWYVVPSAKRKDEWSTIPLWQEMGYRVAVFRDPHMEKLDVDANFHFPYKGYAASVNQMVKYLLETRKQIDWIVTGGDDIEPDPHCKPGIIAQELTHHFGGTFGIMQPTGDQTHMRQGNTCATERVCESPWMGRDWCLRSYQGNGPLCSLYYHFFVDEELHNVARALGVLLHRRDIVQYHHHWTRSGTHRRDRPEYLAEAKLNWAEAKKLFEYRRDSGFPESVPLVSVL